MKSKLIYQITVVLFFISCNDIENKNKTYRPDSNLTENKKINQAKIDSLENIARAKEAEINKKILLKYAGTYYIPSESGQGTGICEFEIVVKKDNTVIGRERCGTHDDFEEGRGEILTTMFKTKFTENKEYELSSLMKNANQSSFMGSAFKFTNGKLYCLDKKLNIVRNQYCCENIFENTSACDCIINKHTN